MEVVVILIFLICSLFIIIGIMSTYLVIAVIIVLSALWLMRNTIKKQPIGMPKKILHSDKTLIEKICDILPITSFVICLITLLVLIFYIVDALNPQAFSSVYSIFLTAGVSSSIFEINIKDEKMFEWQLIPMILFGVLSFLKDLGMEDENKKIVFWALAIYIVFLVVSVIIRIKNNRGRKVRKYNKKIYKDLFYRTTNCEVDYMDNLELIIYLERYFSMFETSYKKKKDIKRIKFGTPYGIYKDYWYNRVAKMIKIISLICELIICLNAIILSQWWILLFVGFFGILYLLIHFIKIEDGDYLKRILIRAYYDEWGCFLEGEKIKFVGNIQMIERGYKYNFVHAMLNLAAFCRAISFDDKINGKNRMQIVIDNLYELTIMHRKEKELYWIEIIPLLIASLFEYNNTGMIFENVKQLFQECNFNDDVQRDIRCFLQGLWATITGRMPTSNDGLFIRSFSSILME